MCIAKAKNVPKIINNSDLKAKDFQEENIEDWLEKELKGV